MPKNNEVKACNSSTIKGIINPITGNLSKIIRTRSKNNNNINPLVISNLSSNSTDVRISLQSNANVIPISSGNNVLLPTAQSPQSANISNSMVLPPPPNVQVGQSTSGSAIIYRVVRNASIRFPPPITNIEVAVQNTVQPLLSNVVAPPSSPCAAAPLPSSDIDLPSSSVAPTNLLNGNLTPPSRLKVVPQPHLISKKVIKPVEIPQHLIIDTIFMPKNDSLSSDDLNDSEIKGVTILETSKPIMMDLSKLQLFNFSKNLFEAGKKNTINVSTSPKEQLMSTNKLPLPPKLIQITRKSTKNENTGTESILEPLNSTTNIDNNNEVVFVEDFHMNSPSKTSTINIESEGEHCPILRSVLTHEDQKTSPPDLTQSPHLSWPKPPPKKRHKKIQCIIKEKKVVKCDKATSTDDIDDDFESYFFYAIDDSKLYKYTEDGQCECLTCGKVLLDECRMSRHSESHFERSNLCYKCGKFVKRNARGKHEKYCGKTDENRSRCTKEERICPYCGRYDNAMVKHLDHINSHTGEKPHKCSCGKVFSSTTNLCTHQRNFGCKKVEKPPSTKKVNSADGRKRIRDPNRYICKICNKQCHTYDRFRCHRSAHITERKFVCKLCNNKYIDSNALRAHISKKHLRFYKCKFCDKKFFDNVALIGHIRSHTGEKPFSCEICGEKFETRRSRRIHHNSVHKIKVIEKKVYKCILCRALFHSKKSLEVHLKKSWHKEQEDAWKADNNIILFKCKYCDKTFDYFQSFGTHVGIRHSVHVFSKMKEYFENFENITSDETVRNNDTEINENTGSPDATSENNQVQENENELESNENSLSELIIQDIKTRKDDVIIKSHFDQLIEENDVNKSEEIGNENNVSENKISDEVQSKNLEQNQLTEWNQNSDADEILDGILNSSL